MLINEPGKVVNVVLNLLKLILTIAISFKLLEFPEIWNLDLTNLTVENIRFPEIVLGLFAIMMTWFLLWELTEVLIFIVLRRIVRPKDLKKELTLSDIQNIFGFYNLYHETKGGYIKPSANAAEIDYLLDHLEDGLSIRDTFNLDFVLVGWVAWFYLIFSLDHSFYSIIWFIIAIVLLILVSFFLVTAEKFYSLFNVHKLEVKSLLKALVFKSKVYGIIVNYFKGGLNEIESELMINLNGSNYLVRDYHYIIPEIGEIGFKEETGEDKILIAFHNVVYFVNCPVSQEYIEELEKQAVYVISGTSEKELIIGLSELEYRLKPSLLD